MAIDRVYFFHLGFTGGNTLAATIAASQPNYRLVHLTRGSGHVVGDTGDLDEPGRVLFYGHHLYGLPETIGLDVKYVTVLRHPWDRVISDWFWMNRTEPRSSSMDGFSRYIEESGHLEFYIHQIAEADPHLNPNFVYRDYAHFDNSAALETARRYLEERFSFVGIMELFDETCVLLSMHLGLRELEPWWTRRHQRTPGKATFFDLPRRIRDQIVEKTQHDTALYEEWRSRFEEEVASTPHLWLINRYKDAQPQ